MKDRISTEVLSNGAIRYAEYDSGGNFVGYKYFKAADEPSQEGTPINKATLLKDATAALFGLGSNALPDDVLAWLGDIGNKWVWDKRTDEYQEEKTDVPNGLTDFITSEATIQYASSVQYNKSTGEIDFINPTTISIQMSLVGAQNLADLAPAYVRSTSVPKKVYYLPQGATAGVSGEDATVMYVNRVISFAGNAQVTKKAKIVEYTHINNHVKYLITTESTPPVESGFEFLYLGQLGNKVQIETGSYVGTNTFGSSNPCSITCSFTPKLLIILGRTNSIGTQYTPFFGNNQSTTTACVVSFERLFDTYTEEYGFATNGIGYSFAKKDGNTVYWYNRQTAAGQMNANYIYYYLAIG